MDSCGLRIAPYVCHYIMFVRFRGTKRKLQASLVETRRVDGHVRHEHIAQLGSVEIPQTVAARSAFWKRLHERLARLSNRIDTNSPEHDARCRHIANRHKFLAPLHPAGMNPIYLAAPAQANLRASVLYLRSRCSNPTCRRPRHAFTCHDEKLSPHPDLSFAGPQGRDEGFSPGPDVSFAGLQRVGLGSAARRATARRLVCVRRP
jgi:hypothetical protein